MTELKTLKDIPLTDSIDYHLIKSEAVKWAKFYNRQYKNKSWKEHVLVPLRLFFNLTEEDLR